MLMMHVPGDRVWDRRTGEQATVTYVTEVPETLDLLGVRRAAHRRYSLSFPDGRWANDRTEEELGELNGA